MSDAAAVRPHLERRFDDHRVVFWHDPDGQYAADLDSARPAGRARSSASPTTSSASRTGSCTTSPTQVPGLPLRSGARRHRRTGCSTWSWPTGCSPPTGRSLLAAGPRPHRRHRRGRRGSTRSSSTRPSASQSLKALLDARGRRRHGSAPRCRRSCSVRREHSLLEITRDAADRERQGPARQVRRPRRLRPRRLPLATASPASTATSRPRRASTTSSCGSSARPSRASSPTARAGSRTSSSTSPACATTAAARTRWRRSPSARLPTSTTRRRSRTRASATWSRSTCSRRSTEDHQRPRRAVAEQTVTAREVAEVVRAAPEQRVDRRLPPALHGDRAAPRSCCRELSLDRLRDASFDDGLGALPDRLVPHRPALPPVHLRPPDRRVPAAPRRAARAGREALHQQVRLRAGQRLAAAGRRRPTQWTLDRAALADDRSTATTSSRWSATDDKKAVVIISDAMRYEVADELGSLHPPGGPLRRRPRGRPRGAAELHPARHGGAAAALDAQALGRRQDLCSPTASRRTAPRTATRSWRRSVGTRSRPRTSRH